MTYQYSTNNAYNSADVNFGCQIMYDFYTHMKTHWTLVSSNNGTTAAAGDNISSANDPGMYNRYAWWVVEGPAGRQWLFGTNGDSDDCEWYVGYSASGLFTGGTTTVMPTATDQVDTLGSVGTAADLFKVANAYVSFMADDATDKFYLLSWDQSTHIMHTCVCGDVLTETHALDADPYVAMAAYYVSGSFAYPSTGPWSAAVSSAFAWYGYGLGGSAEQIYAMYLSIGNSKEMAPNDATNGAGVNYYDSKDETFPVLWGRSSSHGAPYGYKGVSSLFRNVSTVRAPTDTLSVDGTRDFVLTGTTLGLNVSIPWNGDIPL